MLHVSALSQAIIGYSVRKFSTDALIFVLTVQYKNHWIAIQIVRWFLYWHVWWWPEEGPKRV